MKILMIAPEPFFEPRGTPFSEYFRITALGKLGHEVDLVTYPIGQDVNIKGLTIFRSTKPPFVKGIKTGPSLTKIILDVFLFFKAWGRLRKKKYDLIHTHEEANIMGVFFNRKFKIPHLYDMHSSLVQQMDNFKFTKLKFIVGFFKYIENKSLKNAAGIIVICRSLFDYAAEKTEPQKLTLIENFIDEYGDAELNPEKLNQLSEKIGKKENKIVLYTGTLEKYQGIPLLLSALAHLKDDIRLVLVGGKPEQVEETNKLIDELGLTSRVICAGRKPPRDIPYYLYLADVLVSPRILGTNIPLKVYSYLKSGKPVVATDLYTHTQTLNSQISILKKPRAEDFATGIEEALTEKGVEIAQNALEFCKENYSMEKYIDLVAESVGKI
jgi:glycosyltransferase involved in cell wall biosynthesis